MVFADWVHTGGGTAVLDAVVKYSGNSSLKMANTTVTWADPVMTHDTFLEPRAKVILQVYISTAYPDEWIIHSSYGAILIVPSVGAWNKYQITFWYDVVNNIKWSRGEKWNGSSWDQVGTDTNHGSGSPAAGTIALKAHANVSKPAWFDEVEVYS